MFQFLHEHFPAEIVTEIALFEGSVLEAYLRDYISCMYSDVYKHFFGRKVSLKYITQGNRNFLPFYAAWSSQLRQRQPGSNHVKHRSSRKFLKPYLGIVPYNRLVKERKRIEQRLFHLWPRRFSLYRFRLQREEVPPQAATAPIIAALQ